MTIELAYPVEAVGATWKSPGAGLWVASAAGTYLGLVERIDGEYYATDPTGNELGAFAELADAQMALEGIGTAPVASRQDLVLTKLTVAMTGFITLGLAVTVLQWL